MAQTRRDTRDTPAEKCSGGKSFNCRHAPHDKGKSPDILCYRCQSRMGCSHCCELPSELLCLICNNWADRRGVKHHGNIVPNYKVRLVRTDEGYRRWTGGNAFDLHKIMNAAIRATPKEELDLLRAPDPDPTVNKTTTEREAEEKRREVLREQARRIKDDG